MRTIKKRIQKDYKSMKEIKILDCTLRDGGYYNNWDFSNKVVNDYLKVISRVGINYVELGFRFLEKSPMDKHKFSSSADMGIGYSNIFGSYNCNFMITNGIGYKKSENDKYKKLSAQIIFGPKNLTKKDGVNIGTSLSIEPYDILLNEWVKYPDSHRYYISQIHLSFAKLKKLIEDKG